ncbi:HigA family addiction module antitoxin [Sulfuriferula plumbiphila]|uniref:HigA family addiction module antitoxin n=1 Tax=Sulfuriferula plumbiphila TaxID=171865 RepID=UPI0011BD7952
MVKTFLPSGLGFGAGALDPRFFSFSLRAPIAPGRFLESRFLHPLGLSQDRLARELGISRRRVNELIRGKRAITPDTAIRLGLFFGTGPVLWLTLQQAWDIHQEWRNFRRRSKAHG